MGNIKNREKPLKILVITNMFPSSDKPSFGTFVKEQVESLRKEGMEIDVMFVNGDKSKLAYLFAFPRLWARLLTRRYNLIHAHYVFSGIIARAQFIYPVVLTHHGSQVFDTWQAPLCRIVTRFMDRTIVMSPEMKERGRLRDSIIIPCGIDFELFRPVSKDRARMELGLPKDKKLVVFIGQYYKQNKRWDLVQASVKLLQENDPDVELILVSDKPLREIPKYLSACDVLVLLSNGEGSPMVIKEAMACNLPIVSVAVGDVKDVIGGTEGCYICSQDIHDVAEKLGLALSSGKRTEGRENIRHLEIGATSRKIIGVYHEEKKKKERRWWKFPWFRHAKREVRDEVLTKESI